MEQYGQDSYSRGQLVGDCGSAAAAVVVINLELME